MQIFLLAIILILIGIVVHQGKKYENLKRKHLMRSELYVKKSIRKMEEKNRTAGLAAIFLADLEYHDLKE